MRLIKNDLLRDAPTETCAGYAHEKLHDVVGSLHWAIRDHREEQTVIWFWGAMLTGGGLWDLYRGPSWWALLVPVGLLAVAYALGMRAALRRWERVTDEALPALTKEFDSAQRYLDWRRRANRPTPSSEHPAQ